MNDELTFRIEPGTLRFGLEVPTSIRIPLPEGPESSGIPSYWSIDLRA